MESLVILFNNISTGDIIIFNEESGRRRPGRVYQVSNFESGKGGSAKVNIYGNDLFTGDRLNVIEKPSTMVEIPQVETESYKLERIDNGQLVLETGSSSIAIPMPSGELGTSIQYQASLGTSLFITVLSAKGFPDKMAIGIEVK